MSARTWEEATCDVAVALPSWREGAELALDEVLVDIGEVLDEMRSGAHGVPESSFRYLAWLGAVGYVLEKWTPKGKGFPPDFFAGACDNVVRDVLVLLPKKQRDYGCENILWGGVQGVVIRAHDKLARIKNLRKRGTVPSNESLTDSYFDLIGYGIVGAMLVKGTFQLPLEADMKEMLKDNTAAVASTVSPWSPTLTHAQIEVVRQIVADVLAKREKAKLHG